MQTLLLLAALLQGTTAEPSDRVPPAFVLNPLGAKYFE